jgi:predicted nucleotidyltransferase
MAAMSPEELQHLSDVCREVAAGEPRIFGVYLFGSQGTGDAHGDSDVDLGVLFSEPVGLDTVVRLEIEFQRRLGRSVDLVDAGSCDAFLALDVIRGERVFEADGLACDKFDLYVMRRAGDLEPFERERRRMLLDPAR